MPKLLKKPTFRRTRRTLRRLWSFIRRRKPALPQEFTESAYLTTAADQPMISTRQWKLDGPAGPRIRG